MRWWWWWWCCGGGGGVAVVVVRKIGWMDELVAKVRTNKLQRKELEAVRPFVAVVRAFVEHSRAAHIR